MLRNYFSRLFFKLRYLGHPPWDTGISPPELMAFIAENAPGRALDLGCGTGTNVITLAQHGWQATGVDFVDKAIRKAREKAAQAGVEAAFRVGDVTQLREIQGPFDLILDIGCLHGLPKRKRKGYLDKIGELLASGGHYLLYGFRNKNPIAMPGISEVELSELAAKFHLIWREDGTEREIRPSFWLKFEKQAQ